MPSATRLLLLDHDASIYAINLVTIILHLVATLPHLSGQRFPECILAALELCLFGLLGLARPLTCFL
jgi:hypothetical protein